ncbi:TorF family putative porin [Halopseudomonas nanhaiensis]|uniref:TorF family putative porin n=1 Tax=Halopseudomonas nanhaiensis TaxID=2830842 RepID=UPI001CBE411F|nr:TorF family putative porin [Halopseudomonas nanhaiensis]UAW97286.1 TorF family putative porin [Halopseudomonas nanhaiensis]
MMKKIAAVVAAASSIGFASLAHAEAFDTAVGEVDVSMTATLATDYIWRGQSQTDGAGAVQGSLDIAHESGLYIGAWASNVDGEDFGGSSVEFDYYTGFGSSITDDISYDLQWATYTYPGNSSIDVQEVIGSLGLYGFTVGAKYAYDPSSQLYTFIDYGFDLPYGLGLGLHYGVSDTKDPLDGVGGDEKYSDWAVSIGKTVLGLDLALMYSDTDLGDDCAYSDSDSCDSALTFSASKSF